MNRSVLISDPDHFRVTTIDVDGANYLSNLARLVGESVEVISADFASWSLIHGEHDRSKPINRAATRFADTLFIAEGRQAFSTRERLGGTVIVTGFGLADDQDLPYEFIRGYSSCALAEGHLTYPAETFVTVIRVQHDHDDDIYAYDQGNGTIIEKVALLAEEARERHDHGTIEVWPAISPGEWVNLRVELMDQIHIRLHDKRVDRS